MVPVWAARPHGAPPRLRRNVARQAVACDAMPHFQTVGIAYDDSHAHAKGCPDAAQAAPDSPARARSGDERNRRPSRAVTGKSGRSGQEEQT